MAPEAGLGLLRNRRQRQPRGHPFLRWEGRLRGGARRGLGRGALAGPDRSHLPGKRRSERRPGIDSGDSRRCRLRPRSPWRPRGPAARFGRTSLSSAAGRGARSSASPLGVRNVASRRRRRRRRRDGRSKRFGHGARSANGEAPLAGGHGGDRLPVADAMDPRFGRTNRRRRGGFALRTRPERRPRALATPARRNRLLREDPEPGRGGRARAPSCARTDESPVDLVGEKRERPDGKTAVAVAPPQAELRDSDSLPGANLRLTAETSSAASTPRPAL